MPQSAQHVGSRRKLIEVSIPLQKINEESAREKSIRHGHPSTLHLWWSRKPLATARAVLFAQLVDDPGSRPDLYPTEAEQNAERKRLFALIERLVVWENSNDKDLLAEAHRKILESTDGNPPPILDPFAGGGSIPLEAQRLGLEAHASDLNPVAVLINKALIEIPPKFAGQKPVFPGAADELSQDWPGATGLAEDVWRYGEWMRNEAKKRIGHLYPDVTLSNGEERPVISWIWARTVICPNPECGISMPLTSKWWLGKKKGKEAYIVPVVEGKTVHFTIGENVENAPTSESNGTIGGSGATCIRCDNSVTFDYIANEGRAGRLGSQLMAIATKGDRRRHYIAPNEEHETAARLRPPESLPRGDLPSQAIGFRVQKYGMRSYSELFTNRQLIAFTTFCDLVSEAHDRVESDALNSGIEQTPDASDKATKARSYADAVATYLGLAVSRVADRNSTLSTWDSSPTKEQVRGVFSLQTLSMNWDFAESSPFSSSSGTLLESVGWIAKVLKRLPAKPNAEAQQEDAATAVLSESVISTDPPYYNSVGYSDLSDFFYVWLRRALKDIHPDILSTMLVPKAEELVANEYRQGGKIGADRFFEEGFRNVFQRARENANPGYPITVYYAFKKKASHRSGQPSAGWETILEGMIQSGWQITATWPIRSELMNRRRSQDSNALGASILHALRPRPNNAPQTDRRGFTTALRAELPQRLRDLQRGVIAPVDLPQSAIGPGMEVFSRYNGVLEDDGKKMTVQTALQIINVLLDEVLSELENDFDSSTRFALTWFRQNGFSSGEFDHAESIANARGVSLDALERSGILTKGGGKVTLIAPEKTPEDYDPSTDDAISQWEVVMHLTRILSTQGVPAASVLLGQVPEAVDTELCRELASLLFKLAEDRKSTALAVAFNSLGAAWNDIARGAGEVGKQGTLL